jgi:hypothetical protein
MNDQGKRVVGWIDFTHTAGSEVRTQEKIVQSQAPLVSERPTQIRAQFDMSSGEKVLSMFNHSKTIPLALHLTCTRGVQPVSPEWTRSSLK